MTRKKFVKMVMGLGYSRNVANDIAGCRPVESSYQDWYNQFLSSKKILSQWVPDFSNAISDVVSNVLSSYVKIIKSVADSVSELSRNIADSVSEWSGNILNELNQ